MGTTKESLFDLTTNSIDLYKQADFQLAEEGFQKCVSMARGLPDSPVGLAEALNNLSVVLLALSRYPEAVEALNGALSQSESASLQADSEEWKIVYACILNSHAKIFSDFEKFDQAEAALVEAIDLVALLRPSYAAGMIENLLAIYSHNPELYSKIQFRAEEFDRLHETAGEIEIYFDDLSQWWRPGKGWARTGRPSPESIQALSIINKIKYSDTLESDTRRDYEIILQLDEETRQVPPNTVIFACLSLAEMSVLSAERQPAEKLLADAIRISGSCYLRSHPGNYLQLMKAATLYTAIGAFEKATEILDNAVELVRKSLGESNPHYARCLSARTIAANRLLVDKDSAGQLTILRDCKSLMRKFYPANHSSIIDLNFLVVNVCLQSNRFEEANELLTETLTDAKHCYDSFSKESRCLSLFAQLRLKQGRNLEAEVYLKQSEAMLASNHHQADENKLRQLNFVAKQYLDAGLFPDAERIYREIVVLAEPLSARVKQTAKQQLALCLMRIGKSADAGDVLGDVADTAVTDSKAKTRREELVQQSQLAWGLQAKRRFAQAQALANEVVNEAHLLMPDGEESLVIALSILMEQAKRDDQPEEMLRLLGILNSYETSLRLRATMPVLYLEVAQAFAKQKSIRAEALFEQAVQAAELVLSSTPHCLDGCIVAYMNYCASNRKNEKALQLANRLVALRTTSNGTSSLEYAVALTAKARLLSESDPASAEPMSLESLHILEKITDPTTKLQLLVTVSVREAILKKLLRLDEAAQLAARGVELRAELDSHIAAMKASRELTN